MPEFAEQLDTFVHSAFDLLVTPHRYFFEFVDIEAQRGVLSDTESTFGVILNQQISNLLVINLQHGECHLKSLVLILVCSNGFEQFIASYWYNPPKRVHAALYVTLLP